MNRVLAFFTPGADAQTLHVWDVATGTDLRPQRGHSSPIRALALVPKR